MNFQQKLNKIIIKNNSLLCIGLDIDLSKIPEHLKKENDPIFSFNKEIIDSTYDLVCAYKPNIAFYEAYGIEGLKALKKTVEYLQSQYREIPIIIDAKRADIGNTARMYAKALYEYWNVDATTVYPYLGRDSIAPFFYYKDKYTILLLKTSNPDSKVFQDLPTSRLHPKGVNEATPAKSFKPFYLIMAEETSKWDFPNIGVFVGATYPKELGNVRKLFPGAPILTAGIGTQGGKAEKAVKAGVDKNGSNLICNNSREIIYAGSNNHFAKKAREKALEIKELINKYR